MKSALGAFVCVAAVYVGCSWFVAHGLDDSHIEASENNGGWTSVSEPTLTSPYLQAWRPEILAVDPYEAGLLPAPHGDSAYRGASPWLARVRKFDPSSL